MANLTLMLDLDGTLVDSEPLKGLALAETCGQYASPVSASPVSPAIYTEVMGSDWTTVLSHFFQQAGIHPDPDEFTEKFRRCYLAYLETRLQLTAGAGRFLARAGDLKIRLALVSSAAPWMVDKILALTGLEGAFETVISQADVKRHKPDPEAHLLALQRLRTSPTDSIVIEDSTAGLLAAQGAGCRSIAMRHTFNRRHDFSLATLEVSSFNALCDSPFFLTGDPHASLAYHAPDQQPGKNPGFLFEGIVHAPSAKK